MTMKKMIITLIAVYSIFYNLFAQELKNDEIRKKILTVPTANLPYSTWDIDYEKSTEINNKEVNKLFNIGDSQINYNVRYYDNDTEKEVEITRAYKFRAIAKYDYGNVLVFICQKGGNDILSIYLLTYLESKLIDSLIIGYKEGDTEIVKFTEGEISADFSINIKNYVKNPEYSDTKSQADPNYPQSIVFLSRYSLDEKSGKFLLLNKEKKFSKCQPEEASYEKNKCELF
jgi:hypothetical protein